VTGIEKHKKKDFFTSMTVATCHELAVIKLQYSLHLLGYPHIVHTGWVVWLRAARRATTHAVCLCAPSC